VQDSALYAAGGDSFIGVMRISTDVGFIVVDLGDDRRVVLLDAASRNRDQGWFWYRSIRRRIYDNWTRASMEAFVPMQVHYR